MASRSGFIGLVVKIVWVGCHSCVRGGVMGGWVIVFVRRGALLLWCVSTACFPPSIAILVFSVTRIDFYWTWN